jgi:PIN domain nuclease of toxin-antitoxin system
MLQRAISVGAWDSCRDRLLCPTTLTGWALRRLSESSRVGDEAAAGYSASALDRRRAWPAINQDTSLLNDANNELLFSAASLWEIASKKELGRADFQVDPRVLRRGLLDNGYTELPILSAHVVAIESLPPIHADPSDRLLVAQATVEGITLLTLDPVVAKYPGPIRQASV